MKKYAVLLTFALSLPFPAAAGVLVTDIGGRVAHDGQAAESVQLMAELGDGSSVTLESGAHLVAVDLNSGREYVFSAPGRYRIDKSGPRALDGGKVETVALPASKLPVVKIATGRVAQATLVMRGAQKKPTTQSVSASPLNTAVLTTTPTLLWPANSEASAIHITLLDSAGKLLLQTTVHNVNAFPLPTEAKLQAGGHYVWQARTEREGRPLAEYGGEFSVLKSAEAERLKRFQPTASAEFSRRALYAALLMEAGAKEEARKYWQELRTERPDDPALAKLAQP
ncbi:MAG: hypothetical protein WC023_07225 [Rhodocyclaceae bacterium]